MVVDPTVNALVLAMSGLLIGVTLQVAYVITSEARSGRNAVDDRPETGPQSPTRGQGFFERILTMANVAAEQGVEDATSMPRSGRVATAAFYGLVAMLVAVLWYSPLEVVWWVLLGSVFAGFMVSEYIFTRARSSARARRDTASGA